MVLFKSLISSYQRQCFHSITTIKQFCCDMGFAVTSLLEDEIPVNFKTSCWLEFPHMAQKI